VDEDRGISEPTTTAFTKVVIAVSSKKSQFCGENFNFGGGV